MNKSKKRYDVCIKNREINFRYEMIYKVECGIELKGTEAKSIKEAKCNLKDSFALIRNNEVILKNMHISPYSNGNIENKDPLRDRKLLLHKSEILKLTQYVKQGGYTLVPSKIYTSGRWIKLELCVCKGKKLYDKREAMKEKDARREVNAFKKA